MLDRRRIVRHWREGQAKALVTLFRIEGSSYRRTGAHMLVTASGENVGTISGGCLESEVVRKATWSVRNGPVVQRYSTLFDDTAEIPYGLGCGGVVDLLLEPTDTPECSALLAALERSLGGDQSRVATLLPSADHPLRRVIVGSDGVVTFASKGLSQPEISRLATAPSTGDEPGSPSLYLERITSPQRLFILGAGDDARPVVTFAAQLGWNVAVLDGRSQLARPERFPEAQQVARLATLDQLALRSSDAAVLMSHSYEQDRAALQQLLSPFTNGDPTHVPGYIGLLGARHRSSLLISESAASLALNISECCERIWAPVGLDLGGDGPEAVALSVIAEVQSWVQGRLARSRRLDAQEIAAQVARGGASAYLRAQCAIELTPR